MLSFLGSLGMLAVIGFQSRAKAEFWKALFHASLFSLCLIGLFGVLLPAVFRLGFSDLKSSLFLSLVPFAMLCSETESGLFLLFALWGLYLGLMTASLWGVSKVTSKTMRVIGRTVIVMAFGTAYAVSWYLTAVEVAAAIATVMMQ